MRFVKLPKEWFEEVSNLYTSVMGHASKGIFFREGLIIGREIAALAREGEYIETAAKLLIGRGWVESAAFEEVRRARLNITETKCEGRGDPHCVFTVQKE